VGVLWYLHPLMNRGRLTFTFWLGLAVILVCEVLLWLDVQWRGGAVVSPDRPAVALPSPETTLEHVARWVAMYTTPICWLAYLAMFDGLLERVRGTPAKRHIALEGEVLTGSPLRWRPNRFMLICLVSIPLWCFFDTINFYLLEAWQYHGMPSAFWLRLAGYFFAFATIAPAMFLAAELLQRLGLRRLRMDQARPVGRKRIERAAWAVTLGPAAIAIGCVLALLPGREDELGSAMGLGGTVLLLIGAPAAAGYRNRRRGAVSFALGVAFLTWTLLARAPIANFTLWLGLFYLLDPLNKLAGGESLLGDWAVGRFGRTLSLALGGLVCGLLWEFWNYWALAKWSYELPFLGALESVRYFEMPLPGLLGFLPFAVECWVFLNSVVIVLAGLGLRVAEPLADDGAVL